MDPLVTETSEFWKNHGEFNEVKIPAAIQTEVFRLPVAVRRNHRRFHQFGRVMRAGTGRPWKPWRIQGRHRNHGAPCS